MFIKIINEVQTFKQARTQVINISVHLTEVAKRLNWKRILFEIVKTRGKVILR